MLGSMRVRTVKVGLVFWILVVFTTLLAADPRNEENKGRRHVSAVAPKSTETIDKSAWKIREAQPAIDRAHAILGLTEVKGAQIRAQLTVLNEDTTPYLSPKIIDRALWRVTINDWSVKVPSSPELRDRFVRTLDVYVDPVDGRLLKLETSWPKGEPNLIGPRRTADVIAKEMRHINNEMYHGFPAEPPNVSFLKALDRAAEQGGARPTEARQIFGYYVLQSDGLGQPRPVWAITLWGIPPYHLGGRAGTDEPKFMVRYVVDAKTGRFLFHVNTG